MDLLSRKCYSAATRGHVCPPRYRELTDAAVELYWSFEALSGFELELHERPRYGYSDAWQGFVSALVQRAGVAVSLAT